RGTPVCRYFRLSLPPTPYSRHPVLSTPDTRYFRHPVPGIFDTRYPVFSTPDTLFFWTHIQRSLVLISGRAGGGAPRTAHVLLERIVDGDQRGVLGRAVSRGEQGCLL